MANAVKAYVSDSHALACRTWDYRYAGVNDTLALIGDSLEEATRILASSEPRQDNHSLGLGHWTAYAMLTLFDGELGYALRDRLEAFTADGGPLDELAHDCAPEVYGGNMSMLDMMIRNERVNA